MATFTIEGNQLQLFNVLLLTWEFHFPFRMPYFHYLSVSSSVDIKMFIILRNYDQNHSFHENFFTRHFYSFRAKRNLPLYVRVLPVEDANSGKLFIEFPQYLQGIFVIPIVRIVCFCFFCLKLINHLLVSCYIITASSVLLFLIILFNNLIINTSFSHLMIFVFTVSLAPHKNNFQRVFIPLKI